MAVTFYWLAFWGIFFCTVCKLALAPCNPLTLMLGLIMLVIGIAGVSAMEESYRWRVNGDRRRVTTRSAKIGLIQSSGRVRS